MWTLTFKDKNDATITVEIGGGNGTLTGAAEPLITRELETDDPFEPVRYQTGYINLVGTDGADIRPADTFDRPVTIKKNGAIVWLGYIAVEEWNNSMSEYPKTCSLPLISTLSSLQYKDFNASNNMSTVGKILYKALGNAFVNVHFAVQDVAIFDYALSELAFVNKDDDSKERYYGFNANLPKRKDTYTCYDVLSEICKSFGWQAREGEGDLWLTSPDSTSAYKTITLSSLSSSNPAIKSSGSGSIVSLTNTSMAQTRNYIAPRYQVRITAKKHILDKEFLSFEQIANNLEWDSFKAFTTALTYNYYLADLFKPNTSVISYQHNFGQACNDDFVGQQLDIRSASAMKYKGATFCYDAYVPHKVAVESVPGRSFTLTMTELSTTTEVATLRSGVCNFDEISGVLDLMINAEAISFDDELTIPPANPARAEVPQLEFYLQFGSQWYNGSSWTGTKTKLNYSTLTFISTFYTTECKGMQINLPTGTGAFTLYLVAPHGIDQTKNPLKYVRINNLSLSFSEVSFLHTQVNNKEERYNASCDPIARDTYSIEHNLFFAWKVFSSAKAVNVYSHSAIIFEGDNPISPIPSLLTRMQTWYSKAHMRLQIDANGTNFRPMDTTTYNSYNCFIGARQVNWRDAETRLTLYSK